MSRARSGLGFGFALAVFCSAAAQAEDANFPAERFRPSTTRDGLLDVEWGGIGEHLQWDAAFWANYALNPLVIYDGDTRVGALVGHRVGLNLTGSIALFDWVELAADLPVIAFQTRDEDVLPASIDPVALSPAGLGDLRLAPKLRLLRAKEQFVDLAIIGAVTLPTGLPTGLSYTGEGQPTFVPEVALSRAADGALSGLRAALNLGYRLRPADREVLKAVIGDELIYRLGVGYRFNDLLSLPLEVDATVAGSTFAFAPFRSTEESPLELKGGVKYDVFAVPASAGAGDSVVVQAFVGAGSSPINGFGTPDLRIFGGLRAGAPPDIDHDDDGIADKLDGCADVAEDKDGFDDTDGCPDNDNDNDTIADLVDTCPNEAEDTDGHQDTDGCPDNDNDNDGVNDDKDGCRNVAEDKDNFEDNDGCPDDDNDKDGLKDAEDKCADVLGPKENAGCPWPDTDKDGVTDNVDQCINLAGPAVTGGCPDSDGDGFTDDKDKCPTEAETVNNVEDDDGCPDKGKVLVSLTKEKIEILDKVFFDTGKSTIKPVSFPLLQQVATVLKNHKEIKNVRVEGHTDDAGEDNKNQTLSQDRAAAVKAWLEGEGGIEAARLTAVGYGETKPVGDNTSKEGRELNRRVEFVLVHDEEQPR